MWKKTIIAVLCSWIGGAYAAEENTSGLVGRTETVVEAGKTAPNGYVYYTSNPENYTGFISYVGSSEGLLGLRAEKQDNGYGSWELRPPVKLPPGGPYQASVSVRHSAFVPGQHIGIEIFSFDAKGKPTVLTHILHNNQIIGQWHTIAGEFTVPENSVSIRVRLDLTSPGEVFFKELRVGTPRTGTKPSVAVGEQPIDWCSGWMPAPGAVASAEMPVATRTVDGTEVRQTLPCLFQKIGKVAHFLVNGEAGTVRAMSWETNLEQPRRLEKVSYYTIRYRARGVLRMAPVAGVVQLKGTDAASNAITLDLLNTATAFDDGEFHSVTGRIPKGMTATALQVNLKTNFSQASLEIADLQFTSELPLTADAGPFPETGFDAIPLNGLFNTSLKELYRSGLDKHAILQDALPAFSSSEIRWAGIPFRVGTSGNNLVKPPFDDSANRKTFPFLGETGTRKNIAPQSRHDRIVIPVGKTAREAYLLLFGINNPSQRRYASPNRPLRLDDMENFHIELHYADGTRETAFPYSVENRAFYISARTAGAYAVALNPDREVGELILHFLSYSIDFYPAALTLAPNGRLLDAFRNPEPAVELAPVIPKEQKAEIVWRDGQLAIGEYHFDLRQGFAIASIPGGSLHPASGILVKSGNDWFTGRSFQVDDVRITGNTVEIDLRGNTDGIRNLQLALRLRPGKTGDLIWSGMIRNNGAAAATVLATAGAIQDLKIGNPAEDMVFFPRFRAEVSAANATYRAAYGQEFMHMFFDFYNPKQKRGLMVLCDNRDHAKNEYRASKRASGLSGAVNLQELFSRLAPGQSRNLPEIRWQPHEGDWHSAMAIYRKFLDSFYRPVKAQNKPFFRNTLVNTCYHTTNTLAWRFYKVPPILAKDKSKYYIDEVVDFETSHLGRKPDFVHLWWSYSDDEDRFQYGNWSSEPYYRQSGGLKKFREAIRYFQEKKGIPISLYTVSDRCMNKDMPTNFPLKEAALTYYPDGTPLANANETYTCLNYDRWVDFAVADLSRLMRDTGAKILYSDVISSFNNSKCYNPRHGHEVPSNSIKGDIKFMSRLREALPDDVALWTEYGQPDSASMYSDGFISYYFMELNEFFAPVYDIDDRRNETGFEAPFTAVRYLLPNYKLFGLPGGIEAGNKPSQVDYIFFNGEVFHEDTWFLHESNVRKRNNRALSIKDRYRDCFLTANPEPRVPTRMGNVYANRFPGDGRTVWTLLNASPMSRCGEVLAIPHEEGAVYRDLWNGKVLSPEIRDGHAIIVVPLAPQGLGAVSQEKQNSPGVKTLSPQNMRRAEKI